jgi:hypothetical protein
LRQNPLAAPRPSAYRSRLESLLAVAELIGQVIGELREAGELDERWWSSRPTRGSCSASMGWLVSSCLTKRACECPWSNAGLGSRRDGESPLLLEGFEELPFAGLRIPGGYAYFETGRSEVELYDLDADPNQLHNLAEPPRYAGLRERLAAQLAELRRCAGETCR